MAEEIVYEWDHPTTLATQTMDIWPGGKKPLRNKLREKLSNPGLVAGHRFRLIDATGREVEFPLKLVSDTLIYSDRGADPQTS